MMAIEGQTKRIGPPLWASTLIYIILSVLLTWPLVLQLGTHVPTPDSDVFNVYWGNWWVRYALGNGLNPYFSGHLLYPIGFDLFSFAFSPFLALLWIPLSWLLPSLVAYNLVFLVTIVLACVAMDQLVRYLTGNGWAALVAANTFGFAPSLVAERANHLNLAALFWLPWAALLLTRLMREARLRDSFLLAAVVGLAFYTRPQVGVLTVLTLGVYLIGLALVEGRDWHRRALLRLALAGLLAALLLLPFFIVAWQSLQQPGGASLLRGGAENYQTDLLAYVLPPQQSSLFGSWTASVYEKFAVNNQYWAYVGLVPLFLALYAVIARPRKALPWLLVALFFFVLALGPSLRLNGSVYPAIELPYGFASEFFSTIGFNWPNRFNLGLMVALSALVGLASAHLYTRFQRMQIQSAGVLRIGLMVAVPLLILGEYIVVPQQTIYAPPHSDFYAQMAADDEDYAIVDLPLTRSDSEVHRYFQTIHHKPIVGGWDHRVPDSAFDFMRANPLLATWLGNDLAGELGATPEQTLASLAGANVRYIVVHKCQLKSMPESTRFVLNTLKPVFQDRDILVLSLEGNSSQQYNVVQAFGDGLNLIQPAVFLHLPWDGRPPLLSLYTCWFRDKPADDTGIYRLALTAPDGALVYELNHALPASGGLACDFTTLEWYPPIVAGAYDLGLTPLVDGQPAETYTLSLPIQVLETRQDVPFPVMGAPSPATFDAPMEVLGNNLIGGDNFVWVDLFLRSTTRHQGAYFLSVHLVDPETGQSVSHSDDFIAERTWKKKELYQERRFLCLNDVPAGKYSLGIVLKDASGPNQYATDPPLEDMIVLNLPLLVVPASEQGSIVPEKGWTAAYTYAP